MMHFCVVARDLNFIFVVDLITFKQPLVILTSINIGSQDVKINGYNVQHKYSQLLAQSKLTTRSVQIVGSSKLSIETLDPDIINGINISQLLSALLTKSTEQIITGMLVTFLFTQLLHFPISVINMTHNVLVLAITMSA